MSKKNTEEKVLPGMQSASILKACADTKNADGTAITVKTKENAIKKAFVKEYTIPLSFDFFRNPEYPHEVKQQDFIVRR